MATSDKLTAADLERLARAGAPGLTEPMPGEFTGSLAKGEWQSCLASLVRLRAAHPGVELGGV